MYFALTFTIDVVSPLSKYNGWYHYFVIKIWEVYLIYEWYKNTIFGLPHENLKYLRYNFKSSKEILRPMLKYHFLLQMCQVFPMIIVYMKLILSRFKKRMQKWLLFFL